LSLTGTGGIANFEDDYLLDEIWIDGNFIKNVGLRMQGAAGVWALPTAAGTHIFQRPYRGDSKPKNFDAYRFSLTIRAVDEDSWYFIKRARAKAAPFYFASGIRVEDEFAATSGSSYRLSRPLASGVVTGVTSVTHPTVILLNGAVSPSSGSVSGQTLTASATGAITVIYTPVHAVWFAGWTEDAGTFNGADASIELEECLVA
jgi:hypothetical protein